MKFEISTTEVQDQHASRLRRSRLAQAGAVLAAIAAIASGCGQSGRQSGTPNARSPEAPAKVNPDQAAPGAGSNSENVMPIRLSDVCGIEALKELTAKLYNSAVKCELVMSTSTAGYSQFQEQGNTNRLKHAGAVNVIVAPGHTIFDKLSKPSSYAPPAQKIPDINGNPALYEGGMTATTYGGQQLAVQVFPSVDHADQVGQSDNQIKQYDLEAILLIEDYATH